MHVAQSWTKVRFPGDVTATEVMKDTKGSSVMGRTEERGSTSARKTPGTPVQLKPGDLRPVVAYANYWEVGRGNAWVERRIPDLEWILIVAGRFSYESESSREIILKSGDVLLIPPGELHTLRRLDEPSHAAISCIHGEMIPGARWLAGAYRVKPAPQLVTRAAGDTAIHDLFMRCAEVYTNYNKYRAELLETILKEICVRLAEYWAGGHGRPVSARIHPMLSYLQLHPARHITRSDLAREFQVTPEHVNALFRKELGITPTQFIHREKIMLAYRNIRDRGMSVKQAAASVGFADPFYFSRIFRRIMKCSPASICRSSRSATGAVLYR